MPPTRALPPRTSTKSSTCEHPRRPTPKSAPCSSSAGTPWTPPRPPRRSTSSNTGTPGGRWNGTTTARSDGQRHTPLTTKSRPHPAEGIACDSPHASPTPQSPEAAWEALHYALYWAQGAPEGPLPPERTPAWTRHTTRYTAHMRRHGAGTGHQLLTWPTDPPDTLQEAEEVLGLMTKQVFQLKDPVPTSKPDVPAAREHPVFAPGHAPVQQPQGAPPQRGQPAARRRQGAQKRKAPAQAKPTPKPRAKLKSWTKEESAALYPEYAIGTRVQLPFEYATAAGASKWIWAAGEVKHQYLVTGDHQGFGIHVKWDPATPNDKKVGRTIELWRDRTGREMVPMQLCVPDTEHLTGTEYTSEVHNAWPVPQPQKQNRKAPAAQGVIDLLDA